MDIDRYFEHEFAEHQTVARATAEGLRAPFAALVRCAVAAIRRGNKLLLFGNGGSAADAQHLATELVVRYKRNRAPVPAIALTTDTSA